MIKISIIIPVYNVEKYLEQCLNSVCNQSLQDLEIICIDDGSTDSSLQILRQFAERDHRIIILNQPNAGVSIARNNGIKIAHGQYIGFVDSDDWIDPDFYEKLYQTAIRTNADIIAAGIVHHTHKEKTLIQYKKCQSANTLTDKFRLLNLPKLNYIWNKIYKRELFTDQNNQFKPHVAFEDMIWTTDITANAQKICCVPNLVYHYRHNPSSITNTMNTDPQKRQDYESARAYQTKFIIKNHIKVPLSPIQKINVRLLGIRLLKIIETPVSYSISLFGFIQFMQIHKSKYD